jgi:hypothetical protein
MGARGAQVLIVRRIPLLLGLAALPFSAVACGDTVSLDPVAKAAEKTASAGAQHVAMRATVTAGGNEAVMSGDGDFDLDSSRGHLTIDLPSTSGGRIEEVTDGTILYLRSKLFEGQLPEGKTWIRLDLAKAGKSLAVDFSALASQDPSKALEQLKQHGAVTRVGQETIGAEKVTHYKVAIDPSSIPAKLKELSDPKYGSNDIWIGDDGYIRRFRLDYTARFAPGRSERVHTLITTDISKVGAPVEVSVPEDDETYDATDDAMQQLNGG